MKILKLIICAISSMLAAQQSFTQTQPRDLEEDAKKGSTYATCSGVNEAWAVVLITTNHMNEYAIADRRSKAYREYALKKLSKAKVDSLAKTSRDLILAMVQKGMEEQALSFGDYCRYKGFLNKIE